MSTPAPAAALRFCSRWAHARAASAHLPEALASLLQTVVVALFLLTFVLQPFSFPLKAWSTRCWWAIFCCSTSRSMRPPDRISRWLLPYRPVQRGDIVVFHHSQPPMLVKRVVGVPGDRLRIANGQVYRERRRRSTSLMRPSSPRRPTPPATTFPPRSTPIPRSIPTGGVRCRASPATANWWCRRASTSCSATTAITARTPASGALCRGRPSSPARWSSISRFRAPPPPTCNKCAAQSATGLG